MEAIRIIKVHVPFEGIDKERVVVGFGDIACRYGRDVKIEELSIRKYQYCGELNIITATIGLLIAWGVIALK